MNRHELHCGNTDILEMFNHGRFAHTEIGTAQMSRNIRIKHGITAHVGFINNIIAVRQMRFFNPLPVEAVIRNHALTDHLLAVALVDLVIPLLRTVQQSGIWID